MVGPRIVVPQRLGRVFPEKYRTGIVQAADIAHRIAAHHLEVFGRQTVGKRHRLLHIAADDDGAVIGQRTADDLLARQRLHLLFQFGEGALGNLRRIGEQNGRRECVVLRLGHQVGRQVPWIGGRVREDEDFTATISMSTCP